MTDALRAANFDTHASGNDPELVRGFNYVLAIAIDEYPHIRRLYNCVRDAEELIGILTTKYAFEIEQVNRLYNADATTEQLVMYDLESILDTAPNNENYLHAPCLQTSVQDARVLETLLREQHGFQTTLLADPTKADLEALFAQIRRENTTADGRVLLYYAGHGVQQDSTHGLKGYFLPADAQPGDDDSKVSMAQLNDLLRDLPARHVLLVLDCCFAGAFRMAGRRSSIDFGEQFFRQHYEIFSGFPSKLVLTSTSHRQKAFDRMEDNETNSPFNRFLCPALGGVSGALRNKAEEVFARLPDAAHRDTMRQKFSGDVALRAKAGLLLAATGY